MGTDREERGEGTEVERRGRRRGEIETRKKETAQRHVFEQRERDECARGWGEGEMAVKEECGGECGMYAPVL